MEPDTEPDTVILLGGPANGKQYVIPHKCRICFFIIPPEANWRAVAEMNSWANIPMTKKARYRRTPGLQNGLSIYEFEGIENE